MESKKESNQKILNTGGESKLKVPVCLRDCARWKGMLLSGVLPFLLYQTVRTLFSCTATHPDTHKHTLFTTNKQMCVYKKIRSRTKDESRKLDRKLGGKGLQKVVVVVVVVAHYRYRYIYILYILQYIIYLIVLSFLFSSGSSSTNPRAVSYVVCSQGEIFVWKKQNQNHINCSSKRIACK